MGPFRELFDLLLIFTVNKALNNAKLFQYSHFRPNMLETNFYELYSLVLNLFDDIQTHKNRSIESVRWSESKLNKRTRAILAFKTFLISFIG